MKVWGHIAKILEDGHACALVTVANAAGSTPRETGARMVVRNDGGFHGTIGGGTLEFQAIRWATDALAQPQSGVLQSGLSLRRFSLGPDLGQCCGGRTDIAVEIFGTTQADNVRVLADREMDGGAFYTMAYHVEGKPLVRQITNEVQDFLTGKPFQLGSDGVLVESFGSAFQPLYLFGAGHVGRALILALAPLPFDIIWIDGRADAFPKAVPANVSMLASNNPKEVLAMAPRIAFVLAMTHSHALDEEIMAAALARQTFEYVGVIGSETKRTRFEKRLRARGIPQAAVVDMVCPIGRSDIRSKTPAAIAAGVVVELLIAEETANSLESKGLAHTLASGQ
ncbi:xanthine dehydrogenase accessory protein XdhC [Roseibium algae]|uniref:Xanthine dehydrogenase accessory protein XdhC n=1 Tax=Roseibium algae TaxID=3123038 RepID=A0ABU8TQC3_9HYPH